MKIRQGKKVLGVKFKVVRGKIIIIKKWDILHYIGSKFQIYWVYFKSLGYILNPWGNFLRSGVKILKMIGGYFCNSDENQTG